MKITVSEKTFWELRGTETVFYYIEEDDRVSLYLPNNNYFVCSEHFREDYYSPEVEEQEDNSMMYNVWKADKINSKGAIRIISFDDCKTNIVVN